MKYLRYVVLVALLAMPLAYSQAAVTVGIGVGVGGYVGGPPVCAYGYYPDYPYGCTPYGYYGPSWFANGIFIGAGPWYHGWGRPFYPRPYAGGFNGRSDGGRFDGGRFVGHAPLTRHDFVARGPVGGARGGFRGRR